MIYTDAGKTNGCGLRFVGILDPPMGEEPFRTLDRPVNVDSRGVAFGKVIGEVNSANNSGRVRGTRQPLFGVWLRSSGAEPVAPIGGSFRPISEEGAYLFQTSMDASPDLILAATKQEEIQIDVRWKRDIEAIYTGKRVLNADEQRQAMNSLKDIIK